MTNYEQSIVDLAVCILDNQLREAGPAMANPDAVRKLLRLHIETLEHEAFAVLFLDNQHKLIKFEVMFRGTISSAMVYPREVAKRALELNASAVVISHNHPSGASEPSQADVEITKKLKEALSLLDINVIDHFVVGKGEMTSFAERGWL